MLVRLLNGQIVRGNIVRRYDRVIAKVGREELDIEMWPMRSTIVHMSAEEAALARETSPMLDVLWGSGYYFGVPDGDDPIARSRYRTQPPDFEQPVEVMKQYAYLVRNETPEVHDLAGSATFGLRLLRTSWP